MQATRAGGGELPRPDRVLGPDAWRITELEHEVVGLTIALRTRDVIGQAKGVLISHYGLDDAGAFALLRRVSQDTNTKLVDVAAALIERVRRRCPHTVQHSQVVTSVLEELRAGRKVDPCGRTLRGSRERFRDDEPGQHPAVTT